MAGGRKFHQTVLGNLVAMAAGVSIAALVAYALFGR